MRQRFRPQTRLMESVSFIERKCRTGNFWGKISIISISIITEFEIPLRQPGTHVY